MVIKSHIFNKTFFTLRNSIKSSVLKKKSQQARTSWRMKSKIFFKETFFFFTASLATNLNIYSSAGIALLKHQTAFYKTLMTSYKAVSLNTSDRNFQHTSILWPASNRSLLQHLKYPHGYTWSVVSLQETFTKAPTYCQSFQISKIHHLSFEGMIPNIFLNAKLPFWAQHSLVDGPKPNWLK